MIGCWSLQMKSSYSGRLMTTSILAVALAVTSPLCAVAQIGVAQPTTAKQIMTATLDRWGGAAAWSTITKAQVTGDFTPSIKSPSRSLDWFDDLSVDRPKSRRTSSDSSGKSITKLHVGSTAETITFKGKSFQEPTPDITVLLLPHLPALALLRILTNRHYSMSLEPPDSTGLMRVYVRTALQWFGQEWSFSGPNMTLVSVRYKSYNPVAPQVKPWNTVTYDGFESTGGLSVPKHAKVNLAGALTASYSFTHQVFNQPDSSAATSAGGGVQ